MLVSVLSSVGKLFQFSVDLFLQALDVRRSLGCVVVTSPSSSSENWLCNLIGVLHLKVLNNWTSDWYSTSSVKFNQLHLSMSRVCLVDFFLLRTSLAAAFMRTCAFLIMLGQVFPQLPAAFGDSAVPWCCPRSLALAPTLLLPPDCTAGDSTWPRTSPSDTSQCTPVWVWSQTAEVWPALAASLGFLRPGASRQDPLPGANNDWAQHEFFPVGFEAIMDFPQCTILGNWRKPEKTLELTLFCRDQVNTLGQQFSIFFWAISWHWYISARHLFPEFQGEFRGVHLVHPDCPNHCSNISVHQPYATHLSATSLVEEFLLSDVVHLHTQSMCWNIQCCPPINLAVTVLSWTYFDWQDPHL